MPTIDELAPAPACSDSDELIVSQSGYIRKATRAQLLAGVQPAVALTQGCLLGRASAGVGAPEQIQIGANLTLSQGMLSVPAPFSVAGQAEAGPLLPGDLVPVAQGGKGAAASYETFMRGLSGISAIDGSALTASVLPGGACRTIADALRDAADVAWFGATGDGVSDDTAAFSAAFASGLPVRLDAKTYIVNGPLTVCAPCVLLGVPGASVLRRTSQGGGSAWLTFSGASVTVRAVTFDGGGVSTADVPAVHVTSACVSADFAGCRFTGAWGSANGHGLQFDGVVGSTCRVVYCDASGNAAHGIAGFEGGKVVVGQSQANGNAGDGIHLEAGVAGIVRDNFCASNTNGIVLGAIGSPGDANLRLVQDNTCQENSSWGIAVCGSGVVVGGNFLLRNGGNNGGGLMLRGAGGRVNANVVRGGLTGIDCRVCSMGSVLANDVAEAATGILATGCQFFELRGNRLVQNGCGICVRATDDVALGSITAALSIDGNWIGFSTAQASGIQVLDGATGVAVRGNGFFSWGVARQEQALWLHTDAAIVSDNCWNNTARWPVAAGTVSGISALVLPDVADDVLVTAAPAEIGAILSGHQVDTLGQVTFVRITDGGSGYSWASIAIAGTGTGATADAIIADGAVVGAVVTNAGSGYGQIGAPVSVSIAGDGQGATASAMVGLPVIEGRKLRIACGCAVRFSADGTVPGQANWTGFDATVPARGCGEVEGIGGSWVLMQYPPDDYLSPTGDGGMVLRSAGTGDVFLRPAGEGVLHVCSDAEPVGVISAIGHGSPATVVSAPPGSDYRNLDGGAGTNLWVKQSGTDSNGWVAVA
jgi:hypothetical protein